MAKQLVVENGAFMANGKRVLELKSLSVERFIQLEDLKQRLKFGDQMTAFRSILKESFELGNKLQIADSYKLLGNLIDAVDDHISSKGQIPMLLIATLFLCVDGDDPAKWNEASANDLINDIAAEGYDVTNFFHFAQARMMSFAEGLNMPLG